MTAVAERVRVFCGVESTSTSAQIVWSDTENDTEDTLRATAWELVVVPTKSVRTSRLPAFA